MSDGHAVQAQKRGNSETEMAFTNGRLGAGVSAQVDVAVMFARNVASEAIVTIPDVDGIVSTPRLR